MSHHRIIDLYKGDIPVNIIYSQWLGYLKCSNEEYFGSEEFSAYRSDPKVNFVYAHTSGHATVEDLQEFAQAIKPKQLVPIHTEHSDQFDKLFDNVFEMNDQQPVLL